ncbi:Very-long-chain (3R)-3-hydroxyacyl-CoA dehydratase [Haematococcus lacustris]|uniref:very-long-chain (3R)-3-hydroxyacyl-CoA dehydratase n=1 Tax=Haematococcus lacustris TaxID=44745 RepID=A0A699YP80_HAELA|nr:Very-long-chain (3R)-3-hydroxyacyl-CoA dehydratase [Haematococcus lacustris]
MHGAAKCMDITDKFALGWAWCLWTVAASYAANGGNHVNVFNTAGGTASKSAGVGCNIPIPTTQQGIVCGSSHSALPGRHMVFLQCPTCPPVCMYCAFVKGCSQLQCCASPAGVFQLLSGLEVIHTLLGIVRSSPAMALLQWAGRSNILFLVLSNIPDVGLVVYLPVWWQLYASLLKQRAKKLGTSHGKTD